jgi:hypothetical protein
VGSELLVTLGFVFSFHFVKRIASERTSGTKLPATLGATKALEILALNPFQSAWHPRIVTSLCAKVNSATLPAACLFHLQRCSVVSSLSSNQSCSAGTSRKVLDLTYPGTVIQYTVALFVRLSMHMR